MKTWRSGVFRRSWELVFLLSLFLGGILARGATADLHLTATADPNPVVTGGNLTFTYFLTNRGPDTATGVLLSNTLPPSVILSSVVTTNGSWINTNGVLQYSLDVLPSGVRVMVKAIVIPVNTQMVTNRVWLVANETDPSPFNSQRMTLTDVVPVAGGPNMVIGRWYHVATALTDGRVLITGGTTNNLFDGVSPTAEVFNPQTESFSLTGPMSVARFNHTATLLTNSLVLVAGGSTLESATAAFELFDPTNEVFLPPGNLALARSGHSATRLNDGRVMFAGGDASSRVVEIYDPSDGSLAPTGELQIPRSGHVAALLQDGRVLLVGGSITNPHSAEIHDPQTGISTATGSLVTNHSSLAGTTLMDGRVLVFGGTSAELFDPESNLFSLPGPLHDARVHGRMTLLNDGRVLMSGGGNGNGYMASTELFDPGTGAFTVGPPMTRDRYQHSAALLLDGRVLVAGGYAGSLTSSSELIALKLDTDNDGMEDNWELTHGFDQAMRDDAILDADGDGHSNLQEYLAGTDPRDPTSNMRIATVQVNASTVRIAFTSVVGKRYAVERSVNVFEPSWEVLTNNLPGSGAIIPVFVPNASEDSSGLYRVRLIP